MLNLQASLFELSLERSCRNLPRLSSLGLNSLRLPLSACGFFKPPLRQVANVDTPREAQPL